MEAFAAIALIVYVPIIIVGGVLWRAFVWTKLWLWFVVPQFGLAPLPIVIAVGLSALVALYTPHSSTATDKDKSLYRRIGESSAKIFLSPALTLLIGWIVHQFQ